MAAVANARQTSENYLNAARTTVDWAASLLTDDGGFAGCPDDIGAYYKSVRAFGLSGRVAEAERVAEFVKRSFFAAGDFNSGVNTSSPDSGNYRNAWLTLGSHAIGRYDLSLAGADYLESELHPELSGAPEFRRSSAADQQIEWGATASAIIALLAVGRLDAAIRAGGFFLDSMIRGQPEPESYLYLRKNWVGDWITECPAPVKPMHVIELGEPAQRYWYLGIGIAALGYLYRATGDARYLEGADTVFDAAMSCRPGSLGDLTSAKVGWGSAVLYSLTGDGRHADAARRVAEMLVATQEPNGVWLRRPEITRFEDQPLATSLDTSLERVCWLYEIARYLG